MFHKLQLPDFSLYVVYVNGKNYVRFTRLVPCYILLCGVLVVNSKVTALLKDQDLQ